MTLEERLAVEKEKLRMEMNVLAWGLIILFFVGVSFCCLAAVVMVTL